MRREEDASRRLVSAGAGRKGLPFAMIHPPLEATVVN